MSQTVTVEDVVSHIRERIGGIDNTRVYLVLRTMNFKPIRVDTIENIKLCMAIEEEGLPITSELLGYLNHTHTPNNLQFMHGLGDKKIAVLLRDGIGKEHRWMLSDKFKEYYYGGKQK
jgi:hypothetical protein